MAVFYCWSGVVGGAANGTSWADAYTNTGSFASKAAGDVLYLAHDHVNANQTSIAGLGSETNCNKIYCVSRSGSVPPVTADLRTTATIPTATATSMSLNASYSEIYGLTFDIGAGTSSAASLTLSGSASRSHKYINCHFRLNNTAAASRINLGNNGSYIVLENCTFQFGSVSQGITPLGRIHWRGGSITGTAPTTLFLNTGATQVFCEGVDFSAITSGKVYLMNNASQTTNFVFKDCKMGAGNLYSGSYVGGGGVQVTLIRSDSGDTNYRSEHYNLFGAQQTVTTEVRTGAATDGTTPIAWKIITTSGTNLAAPFECPPITFWNETVGLPITVSIEGNWSGSGSRPTNREIWIEVEALGTSSFPMGTRATSGGPLLEAGTQYASSSSTWTSNADEWTMSATITPQEKGPITVYIKAIRGGVTYYIDPKPILS